MNENDIKILRNALDLYEFTIKQRQTNEWDQEMMKFNEMIHHLGQALNTSF